MWVVEWKCPSCDVTLVPAAAPDDLACPYCDRVFELLTVVPERVELLVEDGELALIA